MRIILNTLEYYETYSEKRMALVFLDALKAFDNVNWQFMLMQLEEVGFGDRYMNALKAIYNKQTARVMINGELTENFNILKGTRQGCPLSPLLFVLTLEVLNRINRNIRKNGEIKGMKIKNEEYKLQAFAEGLVFILEEPLETGSKLIREIEEFGEVAGLKINKEKTKILVKNMTEKQKKRLMDKLNIQITKK